MRRTASFALLAMACMWGLTSCTVPIDGVAGVTVDSSGDLLGVISSCKQAIDVAVLSQTNGPDAANGYEGPKLGSWDLRNDSTKRPVAWSLTRQTSAAATSGSDPLPLRQKRKMSLFGGTRDNSYSTGDVTFRLSETRSLRPGQVLMLDLASIEKERERNTVVTLAEFQSAACDD